LCHFSSFFLPIIKHVFQNKKHLTSVRFNKFIIEKRVRASESLFVSANLHGDEGVDLEE